LGRRTRFILAVTSVVTAMLAFAGTAMATTRWVNDNGTPNPSGTSCANPGYNTIQDAVADASPGDTVRVCAGSYTGPVVVDKTLTLKGAKAGIDARFRTQTGESNVSDTTLGFDLQADNIILDGFRVGDVTGGPGIQTSPNHSGYQILNNIVRNNVFGIYANTGSGTQSLIRRNLIRGNNQTGAANGNGIYADQGTKDLLIRNNAIKNQLNAGILLTTTGTTVNQDNTIRSNRSLNNTVFVNLFGNNVDLAITWNTTNDTVNADDDQQGCVIRVDGDANGITIANNTLRNPPFAGVCLRDDFPEGSLSPDNLVVNFNKIINSEFFGIDSTDSVDGAASVHGNRVTDGDNAGIRFGSDTSGNQISGNTALRNHPDCLDESTGTGTAGTANFWTNNIGRRAVPRGICHRHS
jgi:Right handed beta helix region